MGTETVSPRYQDIETWNDADILAALLDSQLAAVASISQALPELERAAKLALPRLRAGGRIVYAGAGTSGRIGVQDGIELVPTFGWPRRRLVFLMAGGRPALLRSLENVEDDSSAAAAAVQRHGIGKHDVIIGIAASGRTPYTIAALQAARARGALAIGVVNNARSPLARACDVCAVAETGAEPIAGSTRMKAGTAQKVILNMLMTLLMIRLGRVYRGMMIEVQATNQKLRGRREDMLIRLCGASRGRAREALAAAKGDLKEAVLLLEGYSLKDARAALKQADGDLRRVMAGAEPFRA